MVPLQLQLENSTLSLVIKQMHFPLEIMLLRGPPPLSLSNRCLGKPPAARIQHLRSGSKAKSSLYGQ